MENIQEYAKRELEILKEKSPESVVNSFTDGILSICESLDRVSQSPGFVRDDVEYITDTVCKAIEELCFKCPISELTGSDDEWDDISEMSNGNPKYRSNRCLGLFKTNEKSYYLFAITWLIEGEFRGFPEGVYIDDKDFELINKEQFVKFPFKPKTFAIDVVRVFISKEDAKSRDIKYIENMRGECFYVVLKDPAQLEEVFNYYARV